MPEENGVYYDRKEQLDKIVPLIISGERLMMVMDCKGGGTGYVALTKPASDLPGRQLAEDQERPR